MRSTTPVKAAAILGMTAISFATVSTHAGINIIVNGGFESNNTNVTVYNMDNAEFNNIVNDVTGFAANGPGEFDIMTFGGGFGLDPVEGDWHLALEKGAGLGTDQFSFDLTINIVGGTEYDLSFWAAENTTFSDGTESLQIGISSSATDFGTLVYDAGNPPNDTWTYFATTFTAPADAAFLTVRLTDFFDPNGTWVHIDDFRLSVVPVPGAFALLGVAGLVSRRRRRA